MRLTMMLLAPIALWTPHGAAAKPALVPSEVYTHPQTLVAVDGTRRLNLFCMGSGTPAVILDAGAGGSAMVWRHVQAQIAAVTRVCAYDRAGYGFSDAPTRASDVLNTVDDLHRLLLAARIPLPIVYVGHSIAGLYGVAFTATYPNDVAGAVLVDPSLPNQDDAMIAAFTAAKRDAWYQTGRKVLDDQRGCLGLARKNRLAALATKQARDCADPSPYPESVDSVLKAEIAREWASVPGNMAGLSEEESHSSFPGHPDIDDQEMANIKTNFGSKPLIVLTHGTPMTPPPGMTAAAQAKVEAAWNAGHEKLAKTSTRGINVVVAHSGHFIQFDQPPAVIEAVIRVVSEVRQAPQK